MTGVTQPPPEDLSTDAYTPRQIKDAALELLKYGLLESSSKPNLYRAAVAHGVDINRVLEPLDLSMRVDGLRGLAYVVVAPSAGEQTDDEWSHPLVRRQRLNLEQSLLIAILRQHFVAHEQEAGLGAGAVGAGVFAGGGCGGGCWAVAGGVIAETPVAGRGGQD